MKRTDANSAATRTSAATGASAALANGLSTARSGADSRLSEHAPVVEEVCLSEEARLAEETRWIASTRLIEETLRHRFGFASLRPGQAEVMDRLLQGRSSLAIFPTGSGKSMCYQLPALLLEGLTVVVSPLIALMKDQLDFLQQRNIPAARLDSSLSFDEGAAVYRGLRRGELKLLYVSPERLGNERFMNLLRDTSISLLAVDEAHCISQWGHNFRPDYLRIASLSRQLRAPRVLALTATATLEVAADIASAFGIPPEDVVKTGFYRPNLSLQITACRPDQRRDLLLDRVKRVTGPAIVYVTLQRTAEEIAALLALHGISAAAYHAGLEPARRTEIQEQFMASQAMVVVATIAFGMGVDKADVRAVIHYNLPGGVENYMQEIGRAGRDGEPAVCELLACADDVVTLQNFSYGDTPTAQAVASLIDELLAKGAVDGSLEVSVYELSNRHDMRDLVVKTLLAYLELEGVLQPMGALFTEYKFRPRRSSSNILSRFTGERQQLLRAIFQSARPAETWFHIDVPKVSRRCGSTRERIVAALDYLDRQQDIELRTAGVRLAFRLREVPYDRRTLVAALVDRFQRRERHDIQRIESLVQLVQPGKCVTQRLLDYFGEHRSPCGHCCVCAGHPPEPMLAANGVAITQSDVAAVQLVAAQRHAALAHPRQLARFLCGLSSPATTRAQLRTHQEFGRLRRVPFAEVLEMAERIVG